MHTTCDQIDCKSIVAVYKKKGQKPIHIHHKMKNGE